MNADQIAQARRVIVNVLSREHKNMIGRRADAAGELAAETARQDALRREAERDGGLMGPGFGSEESRIRLRKEQLDLAEHNAAATANAMEYVALHFVDQLEKAPQG